MNQPATDFGARLLAARAAARLSQQAAATAAGIATTTWSRWERGLGSPHAGLLPTLARVLGCEVVALMPAAAAE